MKTSSCWKGVLAVWTRVLAPNAHVVRPSRRSLCSSMPGFHPKNCTAPSTLLNCSSQKLALVSYFSRMTTNHLCRLFWRVCGWSTHSRRVYIVVCTFYLIDLMYSTSQLKLIGCFFVSRQHVNITSCYKCTMRNTQRFLTVLGLCRVFRISGSVQTTEPGYVTGCKTCFADDCVEQGLAANSDHDWWAKLTNCQYQVSLHARLMCASCIAGQSRFQIDFCTDAPPL